MPDLIAVLRSSADRYRALLEPMTEADVAGPTYDDEWTVADLASHLGSGAEIFSSFVAAGLAGEEPPSGDSFTAVWDRWNATAPAEQASKSLSANDAFVSRVESLTPEQREGFGVPMFGMEVDLAMLLGMRIGETTFHTWDVAVMADPAAVLAPDAVEPMVDNMGRTIGRAMGMVEGGGTVAVVTSEPERRFVLYLDAAQLVSENEEGKAAATMPAEAFLRLVAGRLDPDHTPSSVVADAEVLDRLRKAFPGF